MDMRGGGHETRMSIYAIYYLSSEFLYSLGICARFHWNFFHLEIIKQIRPIRWAEYVVCIEKKRNACRVTWGNLKEGDHRVERGVCGWKS